MVATKIQLSDGVELVVSAALDDVRESFHSALSDGGGLVRITGADGNNIAVNPRQVLYLEEFSQEEADAAPNGSGSSVPRAAAAR